MVDTLGQNMSLRCLCGSAFDTPQERCDHEKAQGHYYFCSCGTPHHNPQFLQRHQLDTSHTGRKTRADFYRIIPFDPSFKKVIVRELTPDNGCPQQTRAALAAGKQIPMESVGTQIQLAHSSQLHVHRTTSTSVFTSEVFITKLDSTMRGLRCPCGSQFDTNKQFARHVQQYNHDIQCSSCRKFFKSQNLLSAHLRQTGHSNSGITPMALALALSCSCGRLFKNASGRQDHQGATKHVPMSWRLLKAGTAGEASSNPQDRFCHVCNKDFANNDGLKAHKIDKHPSCPTCDQQFQSFAQCSSHQRAMNHCYCREHGAAFDSEVSYKKHNRRTEHVTGYECLDCDRQFSSDVALDDHLASQGHADALQAVQDSIELAEAARENEKKALRCEECKRDFKTPQGYGSHKNSPRHKPLSDLVCPLSEHCKKQFTSPSALLLHLESGGCKSGMNRLKLNVLIHTHDTGRQITHNGNVSNVLSSATAANAMPTASDLAMTLEGLSIGGLQLPAQDTDAVSETSITSEGVLVEDISDTESTASGVLIRTPSRDSRASSIFGGVVLSPSQTTGEWSFVNGGLATPSIISMKDSAAGPIQYDATLKAWPCIFEGCEKFFQKQGRLMQHLYSAYHAPKLFRCPTGLTMEGGEHEKAFKTISGFAMHLESGNCVGGKDALQMIVGLFEKRIQEATGTSVKLLMDNTILLSKGAGNKDEEKEAERTSEYPKCWDGGPSEAH